MINFHELRLSLKNQQLVSYSSTHKTVIANLLDVIDQAEFDFRQTPPKSIEEANRVLHRCLIGALEEFEQSCKELRTQLRDPP